MPLWRVVREGGAETLCPDLRLRARPRARRHHQPSDAWGVIFPKRFVSTKAVSSGKLDEREAGLIATRRPKAVLEGARFSASFRVLPRPARIVLKGC